MSALRPSVYLFKDANCLEINSLLLFFTIFGAFSIIKTTQYADQLKHQNQEKYCQIDPTYCTK